MTDTKLICNYLSHEYLNDHPAIYQYIKGDVKRRESASEKLITNVESIFSPALNEMIIKKAVTEFLEMKKIEYDKGIIEIKPYYRY